MKMAGMLLRLGRRQFHTIVSREIIKPSSPTPSHLRTYNLSEIDQINHHRYAPLILLYPNNENSSLTAEQKARVMKKSLSQSLARYYPYAGRLDTPTTPYIDCNDEGVVFVEAKNDIQLDKFLQHKTDETLEQLFPDNMVYYNAPGNRSLLGVQLTHFACGGTGVAVSTSHIIADGGAMGSFVSHWAAVARYGSTDHEKVLPLNPHIIQYPRTSSMEPEAYGINKNLVMRIFEFPNSKLGDLKTKVVGVDNPTRFEVLTSLLYRTAVTAATTKHGSFMPSCLMFFVDVRRNIVQKLPPTTVGNFTSNMMVPTRHPSETSFSGLVGEIKKRKAEHERIETPQQAAQHYKSLLFRLRKEDPEEFAKRPYWCSSLCWFRYNKVDFGWGNAIFGTIALRLGDKNGFVLMDTPSGDGIQASVILDKDEMEIFQNDKELLSFCKI